MPASVNPTHRVRQRTIIRYGVHLNLHPGLKHKRVMLHALPCSHYKQHRASWRKTFTHHKDCLTFRDAIDRISKWALEWHAPIKLCSDCWKRVALP